MDPFKVLLYPYITEKTTSLIEKENKLAFVVHQKANKQEIKKAFERIFEVEVEKVWVQRSLKGEKKAFIKLKPNYKALDVATKLGIV